MTFPAFCRTARGRALSLVKSGNGEQALTGDNTFTGAVTINAGTLDVGNNALNPPNAVAFGPGSTGTLSLDGTALSTNSFSISGLSGSSPNAVILNGGSNATLTVIESGSETFAGMLEGLAFVKAGAGSLLLSGNNNFSSTTDIGLSVGVTVNAGTLTLSGNNSISGGVTVNAGTLTLNGNNSLTGGVTISAGTLQIGNPGALNSAAPNVVTDNGTLTLNGNSVTVASLSGSGIVQNANAARATLTVAVSNGGSASFAGTLQDGSGGGTLSLVVNGSGNGEQNLSGVNTFTGGVTVNNGTLEMTGGSLVANVTINGGMFGMTAGSLAGNVTNSGTFLYEGGTFGGRLFGAGGTLAIAAPLTITNGLENDGGLTLTATSTVQGTTFQNAPITLGGPGLDNEGTLTMAGETLILSTSPSAANVNNGTFNLSPTVPFNLNGATLTNGGTLNLNGGTISGAGLLANGVGGIISGTGAITCPFNNAGLLELTGGTVNISQPFSNSGLIDLDGITSDLVVGAITNSGTIFGIGTISSVLSNNGTLIVGAGPMSITQASTNAGLIQLTAVNSNLFGGTITNTATGTIQGIGVVGNAVINDGTIESTGGTLSLGGPLTNPAGGLLAVDAGSKMFITSGLATNAGIINLTGGTYDNSGHALNNTGQISGWGIFRTGGTGLDNNGSITFSGGLTTINGPVTNENGKTIVVAYNPAIFTGLVTNNGGGTFNIISTTAVFAGGSSGSFSGTFTNNAGSAFAVGGSGVLEVDGAPTLGAASSMAVGGASTLRFKPTTGAATVGAGVTATVASGATLELAGSVSSLSSGANRVNITNSSSSPGILISGTSQQVGNIDGAGTTRVNAGSDLTANHIVQSALVIGGTAGSHGLATIDASDASGNPLGQSSELDLAGSLAPSDPIGAGGISSANLSSGNSTDLAVPSADNSVGIGNPSSVPEPSTLLLALLAVLGMISTQFARHRVRCQAV